MPFHHGEFTSEKSTAAANYMTKKQLAKADKETLEQLQAIAQKDLGEENLPSDASELVDRLGQPNAQKDKGCHTWRFIDWSRRRISLEDMAILKRSVFCKRREVRKLTTLELTKSLTVRDDDGTHVGIDMLCNAFDLGALPFLRDLRIPENGINDLEAQLLVTAIGDSNCIAEFSVLNLDHNEVADETAKLLATGVLPELKILHLSHNLLTDEGAIAIAKGKWSSALDRIFMGNNLFGEEAVKALGASCAQQEGTMWKVYYFTVDSFEFKLVDLRNAETIVRIGGAITKLDLAGVDDQGKEREKMSNNDVVFLCEFLSMPERLLKLDLLLLHSNDIGAAGCAALANCIRSFTSDSMHVLGQLNLTANPLGDMGVKLLMAPIETHPQQALPSLRDLHLGRCNIGDKGASRVAAAIGAGGLPSLSMLMLSQNQVGDAGAAALSDALLKDGVVPKFKGLYLGRNQIGDAGASALATALAKSGAVPLLAQLHLFGNRLTGEGVEAVKVAAKAGARTGKLTVDFE
jgi:Leucine-rich repeat (LRR) protein